MPRASGSSVWEHGSDKDLLLTIIDAGNVTFEGEKWQHLAEKMQGRGYTFTKEACRQHFQKIRKQAATNGTSGSSPPTSKHSKDSGISKSATLTPRKRSKHSKDSGISKSATLTPRKRSKLSDSTSSPNASYNQKHDDDDDEEAESASPLKRRCAPKTNGDGALSRTLFKVEGQGEAKQPIDLEQDDLCLSDDANIYV